ncbi:MAG: class I SAM-dependent methyltransferase [Candidatus Omnitrophica bacterium]|nr:class I SAM-dependent methyltransferase [Candidatus Omnitrophota bacterium]
MINLEEKSDFSKITEAPGQKATAEQISRVYQRYRFAKDFIRNRDVLEAACGTGMGLGYLASAAKSVIGVDIDEKNLSLARRCYDGNTKVRVLKGDVHELDLPDKSADLVLLFEAIYYLNEPQRFAKEARRILRDDGHIIICSVNRDWEDFHPSPYTYSYFSVPELRGLLEPHFRDIRFYGGFPAGERGLKEYFVSFIKQAAVKFDLIPGNLESRAYLKRIFIGKLLNLPAEVTEGMAPYEVPVELSPDSVNKDHKIIYVVAKK